MTPNLNEIIAQPYFAPGCESCCRTRQRLFDGSWHAVRGARWRRNFTPHASLNDLQTEAVGPPAGGSNRSHVGRQYIPVQVSTSEGSAEVLLLVAAARALMRSRGFSWCLCVCQELIDLSSSQEKKKPFDSIFSLLSLSFTPCFLIFYTPLPSVSPSSLFVSLLSVGRLSPGFLLADCLTARLKRSSAWVSGGGFPRCERALVRRQSESVAALERAVTRRCWC